MVDNREDIFYLIGENNELMRLYNTDAIFRNSIDMSITNNMNMRDTLTCALIKGYISKENTYNEYAQYITKNGRKISLKDI